MNILDILKLLAGYCKVKINYYYFDGKWHEDESKIMKIGDIPYKKLINWMSGKTVVEYILPSYDSIEGSYLLINVSELRMIKSEYLFTKRL